MFFFSPTEGQSLDSDVSSPAVARPGVMTGTPGVTTPNVATPGRISVMEVPQQFFGSNFSLDALADVAAQQSVKLACSKCLYVCVCMYMYVYACTYNNCITS